MGADAQQLGELELHRLGCWGSDATTQSGWQARQTTLFTYLTFCGTAFNEPTSCQSNGLNEHRDARRNGEQYGRNGKQHWNHIRTTSQILFSTQQCYCFIIISQLAKQSESSESYEVPASSDSLEAPAPDPSVFCFFGSGSSSESVISSQAFLMYPFGPYWNSKLIRVRARIISSKRVSILSWSFSTPKGGQVRDGISILTYLGTGRLCLRPRRGTAGSLSRILD